MVSGLVRDPYRLIIMSTLLKTVFFAALLTAAVSPLSSFAQPMEVSSTTPYTPDNLINNVFLGEGVEVLNIQYQGGPSSVGFFNEAQGAIGIERGIVMSTGIVGNGTNTGVAQIGSAQADDITTGMAEEDDLTAIANDQQINDMARYTITFVPTSDTLRFNYVFASEEYPEFTCSDFNDVFGFFISGPGINGPFSDGAENIALIPGTDLPVTINNLNSGQVGTLGLPVNCAPPNGSLNFSAFYNDNNNSFQQPVFDGFTTVLEARAIVQPCSTYTMKIALADVGDEAFDSGVFLEAKSFGTGSVEADALTVSLDGSIAEGCADAVLNFSLPEPVESATSIDYSLFGEAEEGIDYNEFPDELVIPAGDSVISVSITAFEDNLDEGTETFFLDVQLDPCTRDTIPLLLQDYRLLPIGLGPDTAVCPGSPVQLSGEMPVPVPEPPSFSSQAPLDIPADPFNVPLFSEIQVNGVQPLSLQPNVIRSVCIDSLDHRWIDDLDVFLISPSEQFMELTTDNGGNGGNGLGIDNFINTCFTPTATEPITGITPADAPFTGNWQPEGIWEDLYGEERLTNGTWTLQIVDDQFNLGGTLHQWTITFNPIYDIFYNWAPAEGLSCTNCPNPVATVDSATTYTLTVTDAYGCEETDSVTIGTLPQLERPEISCSGITESTITVSWPAVAGALGYEVNVDSSSWIPPNGNNEHSLNGLDNNTTVHFQVRALGQCPGQIDTISCTTLDCESPDVSLVASVPPSCFGESDGGISVSATGGVPPYQFSLNGVENPIGQFNNLPAGDYTIAAIDDSGCPGFLDVSLPEPDSLEIVPVQENLSCADSSDGLATADIQGGTGPYAFNWSNGSTDSLQTGLTAGGYTLEVTDANGCQAIGTIEITAPPALQVMLSATDASCSGSEDGQLEAMATGGTGAYTYLWSNGQTGPEATNLAAGDYSVGVTDANGCTATNNLAVGEPAALQSSISTQDASCLPEPDGSARVEASGGTPPYTYNWADGQNTASAPGLASGAYAVTLTDSNGCSRVDTAVVGSVPSIQLEVTASPVSCNGGSDGSVQVEANGGDGNYSYDWGDTLPQQPSLNALEAGTYTVAVTDSLGCTATAEALVESPAPFALDLQISNVSCAGSADGSAQVSPTGGTPPYSISWSNGGTGNSTQGLPAGSHSLTLTDSQGCTTEQTFGVEEGDPLFISSTVQAVSCFGLSDGALSLEASGGSPPYTFSWPGGASGSTLSNLASGMYTPTVTDAAGCESLEELFVPQPEEPLSASLIPSGPSCFGLRDGRLDVQASGGTRPYRYSLDGEFFSGSPSFLALAPGSYEVIVEDDNGCTFTTDAATLTEPGPILVDLGTTRSIPFGDTARLSPMIEGGIPPLSYEWQPRDSNRLSCFDCREPIASIPFQTTVRLTVTDANGCTGEASVNLFAEKNRPVFVATGFTPNGDNRNDLLYVQARADIELEILSFRVFDRWGELVFQNKDFLPNDPNEGWDGTFRGQKVQPGTYIWHINVEFPDGLKDSFTGQSTIIR
jgi:gliding motility-associated-like protein